MKSWNEVEWDVVQVVLAVIATLAGIVAAINSFH